MSQAYVAGLIVGVLIALLILGIALMQFKRLKQQGTTKSKLPAAIAPLVNGFALTPITIHQLREGHTMAFWFCVGVQVLSLVAGTVSLKRMKEAH